jgi:hypothetical protein
LSTEARAATAAKRRKAACMVAVVVWCVRVWCEEVVVGLIMGL